MAFCVTMNETAGPIVHRYNTCKYLGSALVVPIFWWALKKEENTCLLGRYARILLGIEITRRLLACARGISYFAFQLFYKG